MITSKCPYCADDSFTDVVTTRPRHPHHVQVVTCGGCAGHSVKHVNGRVFPLADRTDKESDVVLRIVD